MNIQTGNTVLTLNGGNIYGSLFAISRAGTYSGSPNLYVSGNVTITVNGGQINGVAEHIADGTINMTGVYAEPERRFVCQPEQH